MSETSLCDKQLYYRQTVNMKKFSLHFDGYWREINKKYIPEDSGIYLIYTCRNNPENNTVSLSELIYIGQAVNLRKRIANHNEEEFQEVLSSGETLCYACASVDKSNLNIVENGMVFAEKPPYNTALRDKYDHEDSQFEIDGRCELLNYTNFTITTK